MKDNDNKVKLSEKLGFLTFSASTNIIFNFKDIYYLFFLTDVLEIPMYISGIMTTIGIVWDAVNDPLIALYTANHKFKSGESVRPFALYCCVPWAITIALLFFNFRVPAVWAAVIGVTIFFAFETFYTFLCMPYNSLASLATDDDAERKSINAYRSLGGCIGTGIGSVAVKPLVKLFGGLKNSSAISASDAGALFRTACFMGVLCIVGSLIHYFTSKERIKDDTNDGEKIGMLQAYKMLFKCKSWIFNMLYIICYGIETALIMKAIEYYGKYILQADTTPILASYLVLAIITSIVTPMIDAKIGRKKTMILAAAILILGKIPFIISPYSYVGIYANAISTGFGATATFVMFNTNRNNIADILALQNNRRIDSLVGGGDNLISKLAEALAVSLMTTSMNVAGYDVALGLNQTPATIQTIISLLGWVPMLVAVVTLITALFIDTKKELAEVKAELGVK